MRQKQLNGSLMDAHIDGVRLANLLRSAGIRQVDLVGATGASKYTVSRWCQAGVQRISGKYVEAIAKALNMDTGVLVRQCGARNAGEALTEAEAEWLRIYRSLPPLEQARIRLQVEKEINQSSS